MYNYKGYKKRGGAFLFKLATHKTTILNGVIA